MINTFDDAVYFLNVRRWNITTGFHENNYCPYHKRHHRVAAEHMMVGIHRFQSKQELIDWANRLSKNAI